MSNAATAIPPASTTTDPRASASPEAIIKRYVLMSSGVSLIPVPFLDLAAVMGLQISMVKDLAHHYGIKFSEDKFKNVLVPLMGSFGSAPFLTRLLASAIKIVPVVGTIAGTIALPVASAATTYAVGRVFNKHFACGGTLLDFDPVKTRAFFEQQFREGQKMAGDRKEQMDNA